MSTARVHVAEDFKPVRSGAIAGAISVFTFTLIHDLLISDIWYMLPVMLVAGVLCGVSVAWGYPLLAGETTPASWLRYNVLYLLSLGLLGAVSVLAFEPETTMAALVTANGPPDALIGQALPLTALFTLVTATIITLLRGWRWRSFAAALLTTTTIILLLGLNVSVIGLVSIPRGSFYLVGEMYGLILVLNLVYAGAFLGLERESLLGRSEQQPLN